MGRKNKIIKEDDSHDVDHDEDSEEISSEIQAMIDEEADFEYYSRINNICEVLKEFADVNALPLFDNLKNESFHDFVSFINE